MKLLLLFSLFTLAVADQVFVPQKVAEVPQNQENLADKRLVKRGVVLGPWVGGSSYSLGAPWYGLSSGYGKLGHGLSSGLSIKLTPVLTTGLSSKVVLGGSYGWPLLSYPSLPWVSSSIWKW